MPYKNHADFVTWNRNYQRERSAKATTVRAALEERIIALVKEHPITYSPFSLYEVLRPEGYPAKMVDRAVEDLLRTRVLRYQQNLELEEGDDYRLRLTAAYLKTIGLEEAEYLPPMDRKTEILLGVDRYLRKQKQLKAAQAAPPAEPEQAHDYAPLSPVAGTETDTAGTRL
jgi:hypothetical protein